MARGIDNSEVEQRTGVKSISHETTFEEDTNDATAVLAALDALSEDLVKETADQQLFFKTVTIKVRFENFETHTTSKTLPFMTNRSQDLRKTARELLQGYLRNDQKIRLIGVRVSRFVSGEKQKTLL
jgi:nucleotidyltransferase/DNA polymerase involved in DNA repair